MWVSWWKNKRFWQRFTCTGEISVQNDDSEAEISVQSDDSEAFVPFDLNDTEEARKINPKVGEYWTIKNGETQFRYVIIVSEDPLKVKVG